MDKIQLQFRRGGDWQITPGIWASRKIRRIGYEDTLPAFYRSDGTHASDNGYEYAGPFEFETAYPEPEPLLIPGCMKASVSARGSLWFCECHDQGYYQQPVVMAKGSGTTRRKAIAAYNAVAREMGATE